MLKSVDNGYGTVTYGTPTQAFKLGLQVSTAHFAARKSYQQARELAALMDNNGTRRSWASFKKMAAPILGAYNERWLKTEFNTAARACRTAQNLQKWSRPDNKRLYPNLRYLPSRAAVPRDEHKPFYGIVRPIDDPFWIYHLPPSDYNCFCDAEPTNAPITDIPTDAPKPAPGLVNVAESGTVFDMQNPAAPYYLPPDIDAIVKQQIANTEAYVLAYESESGGSISVHMAYDKREWEVNSRIARELADAGYEVKIPPYSFAPNVKNPDFLISNKNAELKTPGSGKDKAKEPFNVLKKLADKANKQLARFLILDIRQQEPPFSVADFVRGFPRCFSIGSEPINKNLQTVLVIDRAGAIHRIERAAITDKSFVRVIERMTL